MSQRPEILFPFFADMTGLPGIGPKLVSKLAKLELHKPKDLLFHLPKGLVERVLIQSIKGLSLPLIVTVVVEIGAHMPAQRPQQKISGFGL